jgi:hypothetical protein
VKNHDRVPQKMIFLPICFCPKLHSQWFAQTELPFPCQPPPFSSSSLCRADGGVMEVVVADLKEVFGANMKDVWCNVMVTMAILIG